MRRWSAILLLAIAGCTNAPIAGFLDLVHPSRIGRIDPDPLRGDVPAPPPPAGQLLPPAAPPVGAPTAGPRPGDSGFAPPLSPHEPPPLPPSEPRRSGPLAPLTLPNT